MKAVVLFVICFLIDKHAAHNALRFNEANTSTAEYESYLDIVRRDIVSHSWEEDEKPCLNQIIQTIDNVKNSTLWATWIWDSIQFPAGQLYGVRDHYGNYDQCLSETVGGSSLPFRTQYCRTSVVWRAAGEAEIYHDVISPYAPLEEYIQSRTKFNLRFNELSWGICLPGTCQMKSVKTFVTVLLKQKHFGKLQTSMDVTVKNCELAGEAKKHPEGYYYLWIAALLVIALSLSSTLYLSKQNEINSFSYVRNILKCFCIKRNVKDFLDVNENDVKVLHGIRFLSCTLIVFLHSVVLVLLESPAHAIDQEEIFSKYRHIPELQFVVDVFFLLSGFLMTRNNRTKKTLRSVVELITKRYFRLIWWYIAILLIVFFVMPRYGCGPLCDKYMQRERGPCLDNWWLGLLMVANYINLHKLCYISTWYMLCDFHLSVVGIALLWLHQRYRRVAVVCFIILTTLSVIVPSVAIYNTPEVAKIKTDFGVFDRLRSSDAIPLLILYMRTHHRAIPYFVGMMLGYVLSNYKEISFPKTNKKNSFIFLTAAVGIFSYFFISGSPNLKIALLLAIARFGVALMVCTLIGLCEYGKLPTVKACLSWSGFALLSKLTYGIYYIHYGLLMANLFTVRSGVRLNQYLLTEKFFGNLTISCFISLFFFLFVESPLNNLVKILLTSIGNTKGKIEDDVDNTSDITLDTKQIDGKDKEL